LWVKFRAEWFVTYKGQAVTQTGLRTGSLVTQPLVVTLRTLHPAVTHVVRVETDLRVQTAVETGTLKFVTVQLVLAVQAVKVAVTTRIHRQAHGLAHTAVVCLWARVIAERHRREVTVPVEVNDDWRGDDWREYIPFCTVV
jgi:hypothetical protein